MALPEHFQELSLASEAGGGLTDPNAEQLTLGSGATIRKLLASHDVDVDHLLDPNHPYVVPPELDATHKLVDYYISSSHNTYLSANQLTGRSDASAYASVIKRNARCVEIDAWPDADLGAPNVKVTHGYTLTSRLPIRPVLETIRAAFDQAPSDLPVVISLENHTKDDAFQQGLVDALKETLGDALVGGEQAEWSGKGPTLDNFKGKIFCMVEYHESVAKAQEQEDSSSSSSDDESDDEETKRHRKEKKAAKGVIGPALAELGFYASSIKPAKGDGWLFAERAATPANPLLNVEESRLLGHITKHPHGVVGRTRDALLRVYPKGLRVLSHNLDPLAPWRHGAQVVALNFQKFDRALQFNEAMFAGSGGWVLKPKHLREGSVEVGTEALAGRPKLRVKVRLGAISGFGSLKTAHSRKPYCEVKLYHSHQRFKVRSKAIAVASGEDGAIWDEHLGPWDVEDDELVFVRVCIYDDIRLKEDPLLGVFTARLAYIPSPGWGIVRPLDVNGLETGLALALQITQETV